MDETPQAKGSGLSGKGQYAGCRGRDRSVVWLTEASSLVEERVMASVRVGGVSATEF